LFSRALPALWLARRLSRRALEVLFFGTAIGSGIVAAGSSSGRQVSRVPLALAGIFAFNAPSLAEWAVRKSGRRAREGHPTPLVGRSHYGQVALLPSDLAFAPGHEVIQLGAHEDVADDQGASLTFHLAAEILLLGVIELVDRED
jgi:hypothetical protein